MEESESDPLKQPSAMTGRTPKCEKVPWYGHFMLIPLHFFHFIFNTRWRKCQCIDSLKQPSAMTWSTPSAMTWSTPSAMKGHCMDTLCRFTWIFFHSFFNTRWRKCPSVDLLRRPSAMTWRTPSARKCHCMDTLFRFTWIFFHSFF